MIDLETLSTRSNARILIIAAVKFNRTGVITDEARAEIPRDADTFYRRIDMSTGHIDQNTITWWNKQPPDIYNEAFKGRIKALGRDPTVDDVLKIRDDLVKQFGLEGYRP